MNNKNSQANPNIFYRERVISWNDRRKCPAYRPILFFIIFLIAVLAASDTWSATINFSIKLYDITGSATTGGVLINPISPNTYMIVPGQQFRVRVFAQVINPNFTDNDRDNSVVDLNNQALGIQNVTGNLVTSGVNIVNPGIQTIGGPFTPPRWLNYGRLAGPAVNTSSPNFTNLIDQGLDGDLDPSGAAILNNSLDLPDDGSVDSLVAGGYALGAASTQALFQGWYVATGFGTTQLTFNPVTKNVFFDPAGGDPLALAAVPASGFTSTPITITTIFPEPSTYALAGMSLVGLAFFAKRRRK